MKKRLETSPSRHSLLARDVNACLDCHDPHTTNHRFVLRKAVNALCESCHSGVTAGKEFVLLLPACALEDALRIVERLRAVTPLVTCLVGLACWPLSLFDPRVDATLDRGTRLSANTATAIEVLRPLAARPGTAITVSGPQRVRVAVELDLPLGRVRDLFLATLSAPLDHALAGSDAVFHDADGDRPASRFSPLSTTTPTRVGEVRLVPLRTDPGAGLYVFLIEEPGR